MKNILLILLSISLISGCGNKNINIVVDGNSYSSEYLLNPGEGYFSLLEKKLKPIYGGLWVNKSIGGQTTTQMEADAKDDIDPLLTNSSKNILIVWELGNDIGKDYISAYQRLVFYCQERQAAGWHIIVLTCVPRKNVSDKYILPANDSLLKNWKTFSNAIVDLTSSKELNSISAAYWNRDSVHLNSAGQKIVYEMVLIKL